MLIYTGDPSYMPKTKEEGMKMMQDWKNWYSSIGSDLLDMGFPFKKGAKVTDGKVEDVSDLELTGFLMTQAENYEAAFKIAEKCPCI